MDALIVYLENKEQLSAVKAVMKAMNIAFEQKSEVYPADILRGIQESLTQANEGILTAYKGIRAMLCKAI